MTKEEILKKHKQYLFPSISNYYSDPLVTDHASMQYVWDTEGKKYLDFFGGIVTVGVGHANPRVTGPMKAQIDRLREMARACGTGNLAPVRSRSSLDPVASSKRKSISTTSPLVAKRSLLPRPISSARSGREHHPLHQRA